MRFKKQKRHRKIVKFYIACYDFRPPFKVLCDGTFVHHLLVNRIIPADKALSDLLGAPVKLFTTEYPFSLCLLSPICFLTIFISFPIKSMYFFLFPKLGFVAVVFLQS